MPEQREPQWKSGRLTYCHHACWRRALSPQSQSATLKQSIPIRNAQQTTVGPSNLETLACLRHTTDKATTDDKVQVTFAVRGTSAPLGSNKLFALEVFCVMVMHSQSGWSSFSNNKSKLPPSSRLIPGYKLIDIPPSGRLLWVGWLKNRSCHFWHLERYICIPPAAVSNSGFKYVGIFGRLGSNQT